MMTLTREQRVGLHRVWKRIEGMPSYLVFRRTAVMNSYDRVVMVPFAGMWLGIEKDGYTHS